MKHVKKFADSQSIEDAYVNKEIKKPFMVWVTGDDTVKYSDSILSVKTCKDGYAENYDYIWNNGQDLESLLLKKGDNLFLHSANFGANNYSWGVNINEQSYENFEWTGGKSGRLDISIYNIQSNIYITIIAIFK